MDWRDRFPSQRKIAVVGRYPATLGLAPYDDPQWQVWICSAAGPTGQVPRYDVAFEVHEDPWVTCNAHRAWLQKQANLLVVPRPRGECRNELRLPRQELESELGAFFTSSIAWMLGMAILLRPAEIGLWGVEMAALHEYGYQRPCCLWLLGQARGRGIKITLPDGCGLLKGPSYPWHE